MEIPVWGSAGPGIQQACIGRSFDCNGQHIGQGTGRRGGQAPRCMDLLAALRHHWGDPPLHQEPGLVQHSMRFGDLDRTAGTFSQHCHDQGISTTMAALSCVALWPHRA